MASILSGTANAADCSGTNVVTTCTDAALRAAIAVGGEVRLCCDGTIVFTNTITVTRNATLDASGASVTLSGNNTVRLFAVEPDITFTLTNIVLRDGRAAGTNGTDAGGSGQSGQLPQGGQLGEGGAFLNRGHLRLVSSTLINNQAVGGHGGSGNEANQTNAPGGNARGGAILNDHGSVQLVNVFAISNAVIGGAGGAYSPQGSIGGLLYGPGGWAEGGVLANIGGDVTISNTVALWNFAEAPDGEPAPSALGGVLWQAGGGGFSMSGSLLSSNRASGQAAAGIATFHQSDAASAFGGAVYAGSGTADIAATSLNQNSARGGQAYRNSRNGNGQGGAIHNSGELNISGSTITENEAIGGGGSIVNSEGQGGGLFNAGVTILTTSTIDHNRATGGNGGSWGTFGGWSGANGIGGGIFNSGFLAATNSTVAINLAQGGASGGTVFNAGAAFGGGLFNRGTAQLAHLTIASNVLLTGFGPNPVRSGANAAMDGGAITFTSSLLAYPVGSSNAFGSFSDGGHNIASDNSANFTNSTSFNSIDPKLLPLADYGGATLTMALASNSPAINFVPSGLAPSIDQRGFARPDGAAADAGAFEFGPTVPPLWVQRDGNSLITSFFGKADINYRIERSDDLQQWETTLNTGALASNGIWSTSFLMTNELQFYRLTFEP